MKKTLILPTDEKRLAREMFKHYLDDEPYVLLVVFGKGDKQLIAAKRASKLAGKDDDARWVIWARKPDHIAEDIAALVGSDKVTDDTIVCSISLKNTVAHAIAMTEEVDFYNLKQAWVAAENLP